MKSREGPENHGNIHNHNAFAEIEYGMVPPANRENESMLITPATSMRARCEYYARRSDAV